MRGALILAALVCAGAGCATGPVFGPVPLGLDLYTPVPGSNPPTAAQLRLGRDLFHDRRLSVDGSLSCASCHRPDRAFSQSLPIAVGVDGRIGTRNAPALINRAWGQSFFWDGRTTTLEEQVLRPIEDPDEMGSSAAEAARRVGVPISKMSDALATYIRSIRSGDSPFDRFERGDVTALGPIAQDGLRLFRGKARCSSCHLGPSLTDERFHNTGVAWVPATSGSPVDGYFADVGRERVTGRERDRGAFKTPTLREVARTAPYMHDGSLTTLEAVVVFYNEGGRANPLIDPILDPLHLTVGEREALVAFLRSLTGQVSDGGT